MAEGLTKEELEILYDIAEVSRAIRGIMVKGEAYNSHMRDVIFHIHGLQTIVMSQAAGRAHPEQFRLLGE